MFQLAYSVASSSSYLIFIIIIIIFHISTSTASTLLNCYDYAAGHKTVSCGSGAYMYPFWNMDEQQGQRYYCGYPGLGITCRPNGKPPIITISNQSYYVIGGDENVLGIRSNDRRLTIVDPDFIETTCPRPRRNFTTIKPVNSAAIGLISSNRELTFFLNCTSPPPPQFSTYSLGNKSHHIECLDYNNDTMRSYGFFNSELAYNYVVDSRIILADWNRIFCKESVIVQVSYSYSDAIIGYIQALQRGFEVFWSTPIECQRCESSGGFCSFSTYGKQQPIIYNCWCRDKRQLRHDADGREYCLSYGFAAALRNKVLIGVFTGVGGLMFITLLFVYRKNQRKRRRSIAQNVELFLQKLWMSFFTKIQVQRHKKND